MKNIESFGIHPIKAEFRLAAEEHSFRRRVAKEEIRHTSLSLFTGALFFLAFGFSDLATMGATPVFFAVLASRVLVSVLTVSGTMWLYRHPFLATNGIVVSLLEAYAMATFFYIACMLPHEALIHSMSLLMLLMAYYIFVPNRLIYMATICFASTAFFMLLSITVLRIDATTFPVILLLLVLGNTFGVLSARRLSITRREEFRLLQSERNANRLLAHEISVRRRLQEELSQLVHSDSLTGLFSRRHYLERSEMALKQANRFHTPLCVIFLDVDEFKQINDSFGHSAGDAALRAIAQQFSHSLRETDIAARFGGDEFAVTLPRTDIAQAMQIADRLRQNLSAVEVPCATGTFRVTISVGVAETDGTETSIANILHAADSALYESKQRGRNQVSAAPQSDPPLPEKTSISL